MNATVEFLWSHFDGGSCNATKIVRDEQSDRGMDNAIPMSPYMSPSKPVGG